MHEPTTFELGNMNALLSSADHCELFGVVFEGTQPVWVGSKGWRASKADVGSTSRAFLRSRRPCNSAGLPHGIV